MTKVMSHAELFEATMRPDLGRYYRRGDPYDVRLGEMIVSEPTAYNHANVVLLGCPQDEGVYRNGGRVGAAQAPEAIRRALTRMSVNGLRSMRIFDLGDTRIQATLEETHSLHQQIVQRIISDGKRLVVMGGGNDISYPDCAGVVAAIGPVLALNIDAHFDVRANTQQTSGTPYRNLLEEGIIRSSAFYELGAQPYANSPVYASYLREKGVTVRTMEMLREEGVRNAIAALLASRSETSIFWGFDMDVVAAAYAPGVSAPNPTGMDANDFCRLFTLAGADPRTRLVELCEVNPAFDHADLTCRLAAAAIWHFLAAVALREGTL